MKRKEILKRLMSITMAATMVTTMVPTTAFASEADFFADSAEISQEEAGSENDGASEEFSDGFGFTDDGAEVVAKDGTDANVDLYADGDSGVTTYATDEEKAAAEEYLKSTFITGTSKIITNGGAGVTKSEDGLSYFVGLTFTNTSGGTSKITSIRLTTSSMGRYKAGWYVDSPLLNKGSNFKPVSPGSFGLNRPTYEEGPQTLTVTLRLFSADTDNSVINDEAQAAETALASQNFNITLEAAEPVYTMSVNVVDEDGAPVSDAKVTLKKISNNVDPQKDGSYVMEKGGSYTLTVEKDGYNTYTENNITVNPSQLNTVKEVKLKKIAYNKIKFNVVDKNTGNAIENASIRIKTSRYDTKGVAADEDGSYSLISGKTYYYVVNANNYTEKFNVSFTPTEDGTITVELTKNITDYSVYIKPVDEKYQLVPDATITVTYKELIDSPWDDEEEYDTAFLYPENGSYPMKKGTEYSYEISADGYETVTGKYNPTGNEEVITLPVIMKKTGVEYSESKVTILPMDGEDLVKDAEITVTYEEYDDYYQNFFDTELKANTDGTYTMKKDIEYTYSVKADGYEDVTGKTYIPDGSKDTDTILVSLTKKPVDTEDQRTVDAIKAAFEKEGVFRPKFAKDKNILDMVNAKIQGYTTVDIAGVKVSIKSTDAEASIGTDGAIHYRAEGPDTSLSYANYKNVDLVFVFEKNGAKAEAKARATVCWDCDYFNTQMEKDKESLTWDQIKGSNTSIDEVTSNLTLPRCMTNSVRTAWSDISWTSSNTDVISFKAGTLDSIIYPYTGEIHPQAKDTEVTLTATFKANDGLLNDVVEKVDDFTTYTKEFKVTVKGTGIAGPTQEELLDLLNKYYTTDRITDFNTKGEVDLANCKGDLQLPRYTQITDENDKLVFNNKEITVTSENNDIIKVSGYRAAVDRFASNEDVTVNLVVTFTREGVTAVKKIPVTVKSITEAEVQDQLDMMEYAKAHYFDGINDNLYADKDSITGNLHPFQELTFDENGNAKWIYTVDERTGKGIIPDDQFTDPWEMEGAGYNKFKSSNNAVVQHENLVVIRRETDTEITISSVLSSEAYREIAPKYPDNTVLQKLYKQPVSVTVTIKGTKSASEGLEKEIQKAKDLLENMEEGTAPGQYPEGTKDALSKAVDAAAEILGKENVTEEELNAALKELKAAEATAAKAENTRISDITVRVNTQANKPGTYEKITVKATDAAEYGYQKPENMRNQVTVVDALYAIHAAKYGEAFKADPAKYLVIGSSGIISTIFEIPTTAISFYVNNVYPVDETGMGTYANTTVLKSGDDLEVFLYGDTTSWSDKYLYFKDVPASVESGKEFTATVMATDFYGTNPAKDCKVILKNVETQETIEGTTDENGIVTFKADKAGKYQIYVSETPYDYAVLPTAELEVKEAPKPADPTVTPVPTEKPEPTVKPEPTTKPEPTVTPAPAAAKNAPVLMLTAKGKKTSVSLTWNKVKGATEYRIYGAKCGSSYKLLKKVSGSRKSWTKKGLKKNTAYKYFIVAYDKDGKLAQSANIHVTTAGGKYAAVSSINVNKKAVKVKKGKTVTVKATITTTGKKYLKHTSNVRYISSNKKIATVTKTGKIKGIKKGTCYVYCYTQNGLYKKVKVTVK